MPTYEFKSNSIKLFIRALSFHSMYKQPGTPSSNTWCHCYSNGAFRWQKLESFQSCMFSLNAECFRDSGCIPYFQCVFQANSTTKNQWHKKSAANLIVSKHSALELILNYSLGQGEVLGISTLILSGAINTGILIVINQCKTIISFSFRVQDYIFSNVLTLKTY